MSSSRSARLQAQPFPGPTREFRRLDRLKPYPRQAALFADLPEHELQALADNIHQRGLQRPIEILPDATIICGHQRVRAARRLDWAKVPVIVRHDLAAQGEAAVERRLIEDNLHRRQLDKLAIARVYRRLREIACGEQPGKLHVRARGDLRDRLAKQFGCSGRHLDRLFQVLRAPVEIQQAYSAQEITLTLAIRAAGLPRSEQDHISKQIQAGRPAAEVIREYTHAQVQYRTAAIALAALLRALQRAVDSRSSWRDDLLLRHDQIAILRSGMAFIRQLLHSRARLARPRANRSPGHRVQPLKP